MLYERPLTAEVLVEVNKAPISGKWIRVNLTGDARNGIIMS